MEFQIGELSEEHQKYNRNAQTHTYHTHAHTKPKRLPVAQAVEKSAYVT